MSTKSTPATIKPLEGYSKVSDGGLAFGATAAQTGMTGNADFPKPPVDLEVLKTTIAVFLALIAESRDGSKKVIAEKNKQRLVLIKMLRLLGRYVEVTCNDDMAIFMSSGFQPASNTKTPPTPLLTPIVGKIKHSANSGQLLVLIKTPLKTLHCELRYAEFIGAPTPESWTTQVVTSWKGFVTVGELTPGTVYAFQARALGKLGFTDWSDSATSMCT